MKWKNTWSSGKTLGVAPLPGAIDGKHALLQAPANSGSLCFNYMKSFSMVLMPVVDAQYNFVVVDIGVYGRQSDVMFLPIPYSGRNLKPQKNRLPTLHCAVIGLRRERLAALGLPSWTHYRIRIWGVFNARNSKTCFVRLAYLRIAISEE